MGQVDKYREMQPAASYFGGRLFLKRLWPVDENR